MSTDERRHAAIEQLGAMGDAGKDWSAWTDCAWCGTSLDGADVERSGQCEAICADCLPDDWPGSLQRERFELFGRFEYLSDPTP